MRRPVQPDELIRLAYELAGWNAGPGRPRTAWLRRAISSAYYALFHELVGWSVQHVLCDATDRDEERWAVARWYQHGDVRQVCEWVSSLATPGSRAAPKAVESLFGGSGAPGQIPAGLVTVAVGFTALHSARQRADYDHAMDVTRKETLALVETAEEAIGTWRGMADGYHTDLFKMLLLGGPRLVRAR